ncbi:MAG: ComEC/Rec2 family competence protein [Actinobacteria bacterium]|nr:ComEC/Rec2 family competence protein [Actinomycetota bacterium]
MTNTDDHRVHRRPRSLNELGVVALAASTWVGSLLARPLPLLAVIALAAVASLSRRPWLLVAAAGLVASGLASRSLSGLDPARPGSFRRTVTLVDDPVPRGPLVTVTGRAGGRRFELSAAGAVAGVLRDRLAGERLEVTGRVGSLPRGAAWARVRHIVGRVQVSSATPRPGGPIPYRVANRVRRLLARGAQPLPPVERSLFLGLAIGDDRDQPAAVADDFRATGLSHLLAVSGENVAFVLAMAGPALTRLTLRSRWTVTVSLVALFATMTRFEPSVLRASAMAAIAATAFATGRPASALRVLCLAVTAVLLIDPLLSASAGFALSVAASGGIVTAGRVLRRWLPGPAWVAEPLAVTLGAQAGAAPLIVALFGGVPVVSVPANLLAEPAAAASATYGIPAALVGALVGSPIDRWLAAPTGLLVGFVATVGRVGARLPLGELTARGLIGVAAGAAFALVGRRSRVRPPQWLGLAVVAGALAAPGLGLRAPAPGRADLVAGATLWRGGGTTVLVVDRTVAVDDLLAALRAQGAGGLDLVVAGRASPTMAALLEDVARRHRIIRAWWPAGDGLPPGPTWAAAAPPPGSSLQIGGLIVDLDRPAAGRVALTVRALAPASARAPP